MPELEHVLANPRILDPFVAILDQFNEGLAEERTNLRRETMRMKRMEQERSTNF